MQDAWAEWDHVTKVDPDETLVEDETFADVCETGTDAVVIGGTTGVTKAKVRTVVDGCVGRGVPVYLEPTHGPSAIRRDALSGYLIPVVLNAGDVAWVTGAQKVWTHAVSDIDWARTHTEAYVVLNPNSAVARNTDANCELDTADVAAYAEMAERMLGQEIVYLESSGALGDMALVTAASDAVSSASLFYGGGVRDYESAYEAATRADTVVVGDLLHESGVAAVRDTVRGAKDAGRDA